MATGMLVKRWTGMLVIKRTVVATGMLVKRWLSKRARHKMESMNM